MIISRIGTLEESFAERSACIRYTPVVGHLAARLLLFHNNFEEAI